jgi:hypothetical protein
MTPFEHLAVMISIVLGLGMAHLLISFNKLVQARSRVRWYWLPLLWAAVIFVAQVEWWWASYAMRQETVWNFFYFLFMLMSPVTLYLAAAFVLPNVRDNHVCDLRQYYYDTRGWFFGLVAAGPVLDAIRRALQAGSYTDFGAVSNAVAAVLVATLMVSRNQLHHAIITLVVSGLFLYFIAVEAIKLV